MAMRTHRVERGMANDPYTDLWARPGFLIRRLHQLHIAVFLEECAEFDVTPVQYAVLSVLYDGEALDQVSVAAEIGRAHV